MKKQIWMIIYLVLIILVACDEMHDPVSENSAFLVGYWINPVANDTLITYERAPSLKNNDYGFAFRPEQVFIERKNAGWCGTPPISYADLNGTWTRTGSMIIITVGYWGGLANYCWKIISLDNHKLTITRVKEEYPHEKK